MNIDEKILNKILANRRLKRTGSFSWVLEEWEIIGWVL